MAEQKEYRARSWGERGARLAERLLDVLFYPGEDRFSHTVEWVWLFALLLLGLYLWGIFYSWGNISLDFLDWAEVAGPRYSLLKDAVTQGQLPLHAANLTALRGVTDRYFSIPDTPFPLDILLLHFLNIGQYLFADLLLLYGIGFVGLVLIMRKYHLSNLAFFLLFLLFNFNGFITGHLAVGHANFAAYFLLPYYILLVFNLLESEQAGWRWLLGFSILELVLLLQGFYHLYLWCLVFLALLALFNLRLVRPVVMAGVFAVLIGLPRLLPPVLALKGLNHEYLGGPATVTDLFASLIVLKDPDRAMMLPSKIFPLNWWEQDYFIGMLGLAFVLIFGVMIPLWRNRARLSFQVQVLVACFIMTALSIGQVYGFIIHYLPIPPFTGERVSGRFFVLPLVMLLALAVIFLQRELNSRRLQPWVQLLGLGAVLLIFHDLSQHMQAWRIRFLDGLVYLFHKVPFNAAQHTIRNHADPQYISLLAGGAVVALLALLFLVVMSIRPQRKQAG